MENEIDVILETSKKLDDPTGFWKKTIELGKIDAPHDYWKHFESFDIETDTSKIVSYIKDNLSNDPIPNKIKHIYFGLFETVDEDDLPAAGFYLCGSSLDEDEDGDFLCDPEWFPEWRYINSKLLDDVIFAATDF